MQEVLLSDLISVDILQKLQDIFSGFSGMAAITTDVTGKPLTKGSNFTEFCFEHTRNSVEGRRRCELCDKKGAIKALSTGEIALYRCRAGLIDYAAPIMLEGKLIGSFIGGQVTSSPLKKPDVYAIAKTLGIKPDVYWKAAQKVNVIKTSQIKKCAVFLTRYATLISSIALYEYEKYKQTQTAMDSVRNFKSSIESMHSEMNLRLKKIVGKIKENLASNDTTHLSKDLAALLCESSEAASVFDNAMETLKFVDARISFSEDEYSPCEMIAALRKNLGRRIMKRGVSVKVDAGEGIPDLLFGDGLHISQMVSRLILNLARYSSIGDFRIHFSCVPKSYAQNLNILISAHGLNVGVEGFKSLEQIAVKDMDMRAKRDDDVFELGLISYIVYKLHGKIEVNSDRAAEISFLIQIPQVEVKLKEL